MLPLSPPEEPAGLETIFADFERIVPDGMTHWQHRRFFAYFSANAAPVSMIAENLTAVMAAQCMLWQTSPAATEIETRMVDWMRQALGLPEGFQGVIQDTATSANVCAVLTMRERTLGWRGIDSGIAGEKQLRIYASPVSANRIWSKSRPMVPGRSTRRRSAGRSTLIVPRVFFRPVSSSVLEARQLARPTMCARPSKWHESMISTSTSTPRGPVPR